MDHTEEVTALLDLHPGTAVNLLMPAGGKVRSMSVIVDAVLDSTTMIAHAPGGRPVRWGQIIGIGLAGGKEGEGEDDDLNDLLSGIDF